MYQENYDAKVDVYAFGMAVLEMVTKEIPYKELKSWMKIMNASTSGQKPLSFFRIKLTILRSFLELAIEPDPLKRPSSSQLSNHPFLSTNRFDQYVIELFPVKEAEKWRELGTFPLDISSNYLTDPSLFAPSPTDSTSPPITPPVATSSSSSAISSSPTKPPSVLSSSSQSALQPSKLSKTTSESTLPVSTPAALTPTPTARSRAESTPHNPSSSVPADPTPPAYTSSPSSTVSPPSSMDDPLLASLDEDYSGTQPQVIRPKSIATVIPPSVVSSSNEQNSSLPIPSIRPSSVGSIKSPSPNIVSSSISPNSPYVTPQISRRNTSATPINPSLQDFDPLSVNHEVPSNQAKTKAEPLTINGSRLVHIAFVVENGVKLKITGSITKLENPLKPHIQLKIPRGSRKSFLITFEYHFETDDPQSIASYFIKKLNLNPHVYKRALENVLTGLFNLGLNHRVLPVSYISSFPKSFIDSRPEEITPAATPLPGLSPDISQPSSTSPSSPNRNRKLLNSTRHPNKVSSLTTHSLSSDNVFNRRASHSSSRSHSDCFDPTSFLVSNSSAVDQANSSKLAHAKHSQSALNLDPLPLPPIYKSEPSQPSASSYDASKSLPDAIEFSPSKGDDPDPSFSAADVDHHPPSVRDPESVDAALELIFSPPPPDQQSSRGSGSFQRSTSTSDLPSPSL